MEGLEACLKSEEHDAMDGFEGGLKFKEHDLWEVWRV